MTQYLRNSETIASVFAISGKDDSDEPFHNSEMEHWIESRLREIGKSKTALAKVLGVNPSRVTEIIRNTRKVQAHEVRILAEYLKMSERDVLTKVTDIPPPGAPDEEITIHVQGAVQAGEWSAAEKLPPDEWYAKTIKRDPRFPNSTYEGYEVRGPSMNEIYPEGSVIVAVSIFEGEEIEIQSGEKVIVRRVDDHGLIEHTVKEYRVLEDGRRILQARSSDPTYAGAIELKPDSEDSQELSSSQITGLVVRHIP